jgi:hypothetical protein
MPIKGLSGRALREHVLESWGWRHNIQQQIVNTDIDGLLCGALLWHLKGWPIVGFYDTENLWLSKNAERKVDLSSTIWVDIDMAYPGALCLSQHVVLATNDDADKVEAFKSSINPNLFPPVSVASGYRDKYPYGTFQWLCWLVGRSIEPPSLNDRVKTGIAWMPDGGFKSIQGIWQRNCLEWATEKLPNSIMHPLAAAGVAEAESYVEEAEEYLRFHSGITRGWRNHQLNMSVGTATGPKVLIDISVDFAEIQKLLDVVSHLYGWRKVDVPETYDLFRGKWNTSSSTPKGWPDCANAGDVISIAATRASQFCWTVPGNGPNSLAAIFN